MVKIILYIAISSIILLFAKTSFSQTYNVIINLDDGSVINTNVVLQDDNVESVETVVIEEEENNLENQEDFVENLAQALGLDGED